MKRLFGITVVGLGVMLGACRPNTEAQAGSCSPGASLQSMSGDNTSGAPRRALEEDEGRVEVPGQNGVGGFLVFGAPGGPAPQLRDGPRPFDAGVAHCTVNLFDVSWLSAAATQPTSKVAQPLKLLVWTSRNCVDFSKDQAAWLFLDHYIKPFSVVVERMRLPATVRARIRDSAASWMTASSQQSKSQAFADVDNFDRFVVTFKGPSIPMSVPSLKAKLTAVFESRRAMISTMRQNEPDRFSALQRWSRETETQALLRLAAALVAGGLRCGGAAAAPVSAQGASCDLARQVLLDEHRAAGALLALDTQALDKVWVDAASGSAAVESAIKRVARSRLTVFSETVQRLETVAQAQALGSQSSAMSQGMALPQVSQPQQPIAGQVLFSSNPNDLARLHGFHRSSADAEHVAYSGHSVVALMQRRVSGPAAALAPLRDNETSLVRGLSLGGLALSATDEGQMLSFGGLVPAAMVSVPGVTFGLSPASGDARPRGSKSKPSGYSRTNCK